MTQPLQTAQWYPPRAGCGRHRRGGPPRACRRPGSSRRCAPGGGQSRWATPCLGTSTWRAPPQHADVAAKSEISAPREVVAPSSASTAITWRRRSDRRSGLHRVLAAVAHRGPPPRASGAPPGKRQPHRDSAAANPEIRALREAGFPAWASTGTTWLCRTTWRGSATTCCGRFGAAKDHHNVLTSLRRAKSAHRVQLVTRR
jgi:hypothetical protein